MATAILPPRDCLQGRFRRETLSHARRIDGDLIANPNPNSANSRRRKRSPTGNRNQSRSQSQPLVAKLPGNNFVMGEVKILKRGELLDSVEKKTTTQATGGLKMEKGKKKEEKVVADLGLGSTDRLGPEPETVQKEIRVQEFNSNKVVEGMVYAGSAFFTSPPPSSLPVPAFLGKDDATAGLRRLLGLNLV
ncbi:hypothetical protein LINPERPRIM_LOCUS34351 [Linum perenne]